MRTIMAVFTTASPPTSPPPTDWSRSAICAQTDLDALFAPRASTQRAAAGIVCRHCPVRVECLAEALDNQIDHGVWGGLTVWQRRALLRRRPDVTSWRRLLESARATDAETALRDAGVSSLGLAVALAAGVLTGLVLLAVGPTSAYSRWVTAAVVVAVVLAVADAVLSFLDRGGWR